MISDYNNIKEIDYFFSLYLQFAAVILLLWMLSSGVARWCSG